MKIFVDQIPKKPEECIFSRYGRFDIPAECGLEKDGVRCHLNFHIPCNKLITYKEKES